MECNSDSFNPEFFYWRDGGPRFVKPRSNIIGGDTTEGGQKSNTSTCGCLFNWVSTDKILTTNVWSSELSKLTANAF
jgi:UDPglucose 6-dehydrogenase